MQHASDGHPTFLATPAVSDLSATPAATGALGRLTDASNGGVLDILHHRFAERTVIIFNAVAVVGSSQHLIAVVLGSLLGVPLWKGSRSRLRVTVWHLCHAIHLVHGLQWLKAPNVCPPTDHVVVDSRELLRIDSCLRCCLLAGRYFEAGGRRDFLTVQLLACGVKVRIRVKASYSG